jgi:hypothetical protein
VHPQRSVITRAVGTDPDVDVDTFTVTARAGDLYLLCSDGLTDVVAEEEIFELVEQNRPDIDRALRALVKEANRGGGDDNITVVAFEITDEAVNDGQTKEHALPADYEPAPADDEDTLTEADQVPVVSGNTMIVRADELLAQIDAGRDGTEAQAETEVDADAEAEAAGARRRIVRRRAVAWFVLLLLAAAIVAVVLWKLDLFG